MGCSCHKTAADAAPAVVDGPTKPMEQCAACAQKHAETAYGLFTEYSYEAENRRAIRANLRMLVCHTCYRWPQIASLARKIAVVLQRNEDGADTLAQFQSLCRLTDTALYADNPQFLTNLETLRNDADADHPHQA